MACEKCKGCPQIQASVIAYPGGNGAYHQTICGLLGKETYMIHECPYSDERRFRDPLAGWRREAD